MQYRRNFARHVPAAVFTVASCLSLAHTAGAQEPYPDRPIRFFVPFPPGGSTDIVSRFVGQKLTERFGRQVVVENRAGGSGIIAAEAVTKAPADGYLLLLGNTGIFAINPNLYPKLPYDPIRDYAPVSMLTRVPNVLVVHPVVPARTVKELVKLAREGSRKMNYGSAGSGSLQHLAMEMFKTAAKVDFTHIPYKGAGPALIDLLGGHLDLQVATMPSCIAHMKAGRLRGLAIGDARRSVLMPELPTIAESGYPNYEAYSWHGIFVRAGTPSQIVETLNREVVAALATPEAKEVLVKGGFEVVGSSIPDFREAVRRDLGRYADAVKSAGARVD